MQVYDKIRLVIFDLDDTLIPTKLLHRIRHGEHEVDLAHHLIRFEIEAYQGVQKALKEIDLSYLTGVVTSSPTWYVKQLISLCLPESSFDFMVTYNDVTHLKPHPEPLNRALAISKVKSNQAIYIGNEQVDLLASAAAGVKFIGAGWSDRRNYEKDLENSVQNPQEVIELLKVGS